jgi:hypothetical protein
MRASRRPRVPIQASPDGMKPQRWRGGAVPSDLSPHSRSTCCRRGRPMLASAGCSMVLRVSTLINLMPSDGIVSASSTALAGRRPLRPRHASCAGYGGRGASCGNGVIKLPYPLLKYSRRVSAGTARYCTWGRDLNEPFCSIAPCAHAWADGSATAPALGTVLMHRA